jgi:2-methylcitrate dehydratase PrpD
MRQLYERLPAGRGAHLLRSGFGEVGAASAALANATATSFLELDEGSRPTGHPALHIVPAALALAQTERRAGADLIAAIVVAYEVQARLANSCTLSWPVHPHGNLGNPAAAAALGKLSDWNVEQIEQGMNIAASLATATSWSSCTEGATTRNAFAGITAQTAFTVKLLVESGFTGSEIAFSETFGVILGSDFQPNALTRGLGADFAIEHGYFKFHAACALTHPVLDALSNALGGVHTPGTYPPLLIKNRPAVDDVRRVHVQVSERGTRLADMNRPNQLSAKFSIPYATAAFLLHGTAAPDSFRGETIVDMRVQELARRVDVKGSDDLTKRWPHEFAANVEIELADGTRLCGSCTNPYGSADHPAREDDLRAKFFSLSAPALTEPEQDRLWEEILTLETCTDVYSLGVR